MPYLRVTRALGHAITSTALILSSIPGHAADDGIRRLIAVTQHQAAKASATALAAAEKQRRLIAERRAQGQDVKVEEELYVALRTSARQVKDLEQRMRQLQAQVKQGCP